MRAFHRISLLACSEGRPEEIASRVLREFARGMEFRRAEIWVLDKDSRLRRMCAHGRLPANPGPADVHLRDCPFGRSLARRRQAVLHAAPGRASARGRLSAGGSVSARGSASVRRSVSARGSASARGLAPGRRRFCHLRWYGLRDLFGAALRGPSGPLGFLLADRGGRSFEMSAVDLEVATALAGLVAEVVKGALARDAEGKRQAGLLLLYRVGRLISAEESLPTLLPRLARLVREMAGVHGVVVALHDERSAEFEVVAIAGPPGQYSRGYRFPARPDRSCLSPRVLRTGRPQRVDDLRRAPEICAYWPDSRSALVLPIRSSGRILGTFRLEAVRPLAFGEEDVRLHSTLAEQIGHAIRRARVIESLSRKQADLRAVSESLERRLEEERCRIARELHDELGQSMTAARINLGLLRSLTRGASPEVRRAIRETDAVVLKTIGETRRIAMDLRPAMLDELGLVPAVRWYADSFARRTGIGVELHANGADRLVERDSHILLFRFFQEALTNVARHARARRVRVGLSRVSGSLRAAVADDGVGMKPGATAHQGLGLLGMRERIERAGGLLRIDSRPGRGTRLVAEIPLHAGAARRGRAGHRGGPEGSRGGLA